MKTVETFSAMNSGDVIEVVDENNGLYARVRIREPKCKPPGKASIFLTPDELEAHAHACIILAANMRDRR